MCLIYRRHRQRPWRSLQSSYHVSNGDSGDPSSLNVETFELLYRHHNYNGPAVLLQSNRRSSRQINQLPEAILGIARCEGFPAIRGADMSRLLIQESVHELDRIIRFWRILMSQVDEILLPAPAVEQALEGFAYDVLADGSQTDAVISEQHSDGLRTEVALTVFARLG